MVTCLRNILTAALTILSVLALASYTAVAVVGDDINKVSDDQSFTRNITADFATMNSSETPEQDLNTTSSSTENNPDENISLRDFSEGEREFIRKKYEEGYNTGNRTGYRTGYIKAYQKNTDTEIYYPDAVVKEQKSSIEVGEYTFLFGEVKGDYVGVSWSENNTIKLELSELETADDLETLCDHEVAHQLFPDFEHSSIKEVRHKDPIYKYSDDMDIKVCDRLAKNLSATENLENFQRS